MDDESIRGEKIIMGIFTVLPIVLLIMILILAMVGKGFIRKGILAFNRKFHFWAAFGFIGLLLIMTILAEVLYPTSQVSKAPPKMDNHFPYSLKAYNAISDDVIEGKKVDSSLLVASRTHEVGDQLEIMHRGEFYDFPMIYIERSDTASNTVEEYVYKPYMFVNDYDYTEQLNLHLPTWQDDTMTIVDMVDFQLNLVSFSDASLFKQFTSAGLGTVFSGGVGSSSASPIIHLIVPEDVEVIAPFDDVMFVEDMREEW